MGKDTKRIPKWAKWGAAGSAVWLALALVSRKHITGLQEMSPSELLEPIAIGLIVIWIVMWIFKRDNR